MDESREETPASKLVQTQKDSSKIRGDDHGRYPGDFHVGDTT